MPELKTKKNKANVDDFLSSVADEQQRADVKVILGIMQKVTKAMPAMWGPAIVGLGEYTYNYPNGRQLEWFRMGLSPRKGVIALYFCGYDAVNDPLLATLGKYKTGKSCLYIKRLAEVDRKVLEKLIKAAK